MRCGSVTGARRQAACERPSTSQALLNLGADSGRRAVNNSPGNTPTRSRPRATRPSLDAARDAAIVLVITGPTQDHSGSEAPEHGSRFASEIAKSVQVELKEIESELLTAWYDALDRDPHLSSRLNFACRLIHNAVAVLSTDELIGYG